MRFAVALLAILAMASACSGPPQSVAEVIAFTSHGQLHSAMYLTDTRGNYVAADGTARITVSCYECSNLEQGELLWRWDEAVDADRFDVRIVPVTGFSNLRRRNAVYRFASQELDEFEGLGRLQNGDTPELCVDLVLRGSRTMRGCERMYWRYETAS